MLHWPAGVCHIKQQGRRNIVESGFEAPGIDAGMTVGKVTGLPYQLWHLAGKVNSVLAGAAADFQNPVGPAEYIPDNLEDGFPVFVTGL